MDVFNDDTTAGCFVAVCVVALIGLSGWAVHACYIAEDATLGRVEQDVKTQNFEHSQAYKAGQRRNFDELVLAYKRARTDDERSTILEVLRHRVQGTPAEAIPQDIKDFLQQHSNE